MLFLSSECCHDIVVLCEKQFYAPPAGRHHSQVYNLGTLKFSILFFYRRLTANGRLTANHFLTILFWFCSLTYGTLMVTISSTCRPYSSNWQIRPLPGPECIFRAQNFIALAVLNIVTDFAILAIPIPILRQLRISWWRKLAVTLLLCGGLFVITAAIIRAALTLGSSPSVITINLWGSRETVVALVAVSAPVLSPLFRRAFWGWGEYRGPVERARVEWKDKPRSGLWEAGRKILPQRLFGSSLGSRGSRGSRSAVLNTPAGTVAIVETEETLSETVEETVEETLSEKKESQEPDIEAAMESSYPSSGETPGSDSLEHDGAGESDGGDSNNT